ncbi:MAG: hypothetical protein IJR57_08030 [Ruminococcus sp.]|nr:hypothetical protein [Ruminococcus sp.]
MAMSAGRWLLNKFKDINHDRMNKHVEIIQKNTGKSKFYIRMSMLWNFLTRGTGYTDYFRCNFIELSNKEKDTFATAKKFYKLLAYLNNEEYLVVLNDKLIFNELFKEYLKRDFINLRVSTADDLRKFLDGKTTVFAKETHGEGGHGITKLKVAEIKDVDALYKELIEKDQLLVEDAIIQHEDLNAINPYVVNSFRVITLMKDGKATMIANALRINQDDAEVIGCTNDLYFSIGADGKIDSNVVDDYGDVYDTHPMTGMKFSDVYIHGVKEAFDMCVEAHKRIPQVRYIGWDVAFSVNGPLLVEGNEYPGYGLVQHFKLKDKRTGHFKEIADVLGDEFNQIKL